MSILDDLERAEREATDAPWDSGAVHESQCIFQSGEEGKGALAWTSTQRFREGPQNAALIALLRNHAADLLAVARAAQVLEDHDNNNPRPLRTSLEKVYAALAPLTRESER